MTKLLKFTDIYTNIVGKNAMRLLVLRSLLEKYIWCICICYIDFTE